MKQTENKTISIVFFGTHDFASIILEGLINSPFISVDLVITQPDKPVGRSQKLQSSPTKELAIKHGIPFEQPESLKSFKFSISNFDVGVVVQYGLLIPEGILNTPKHGIINIHGSILPKYRGASPIQSALINDETETGITIMKMDKGLDTGAILLQKSVKIDPDDTYPDLSKKLAQIGAECVLEAIPDYISGKLAPTPQDNTQATVCRELSRKDGKIDWSKSAIEIYNQYRGMTPWPGVWTVWEGKRLKLIKIKPIEKKLMAGIVSVGNDTIHIGCGKYAIEIFEIQLEGKKEMDVKTFLNGYKNINKALLKD